MKPGELAILIPFLTWLILLVLTLTVSLWAFLDARRRSKVALIALCLWCALAGGTLNSALWAAITTENMRFQQRKLAHLPDAARASDVNLQPMAALKFFVSLDRFGRRLGYVTVIIPLVLSIRLLSYARARPASMEKSVVVPEDEERFTIE